MASDSIADRASRPSWPVLAVSALLALTLALAACGSDDDDGGGTAAAGGGGEPAAASSDAGGGSADGGGAASGGSDDEQITALFRDLQAAFIAADGVRFCALLAADGQAEVVRYGKVVGHKGDCAKVMTRLGQATKRADVRQIRSRVLSVKVNGDKAVAMVKDGDRTPVPLNVVRVDGEWRLPSPGLEASLAPEPTGTGKTP
jgi:hypothetical protein